MPRRVTDERSTNSLKRPAPPAWNRREWLAGTVLGTLGMGLGGCPSAGENGPPPKIIGRVVTHSMAPRYLGVHQRAHCSKCGFEFPIAWEGADQLDFVCPRCGQSQSIPFLTRLEDGQRVELEPVSETGTGRARPKRFDVVAVSATAPPANGQHEVAWLLKRVIGLPGESIEFRQGDLFIDGDLIHKPLPQQLAQRVLVYQDSAEFVSPRLGWSAKSDSGWHKAGDVWQLSASPPSPDEDKLTYSHCRCVVTSSDTAQPAPIEDTLAYSQRRPRRLNPVHDLMLQTRVRASGDAVVTCGLASGQAWSIVEFDFLEQVVRVTVPGAQTARELVAHLPATEWLDVLVSNFDRSLVVAIDGQAIGEVPFVDAGYATRREQFTDRPVWWMATGPVELKGNGVYRDLHLVGPYGDEQQWGLGRRLGNREFFLVGDNLADSVDNRISGRGVDLLLIRGKVVE